MDFAAAGFVGDNKPPVAVYRWRGERSERGLLLRRSRSSDSAEHGAADELHGRLRLRSPPPSSPQPAR